VLPVKILIVTSCTKDKIKPPDLPDHNQLTSEQLWDDCNDDRVTRSFGELENHKIPANELYRGRQHVQLMQAVNQLRQVFGEDVVDVKIISAGFGLVDETQPLPPYNATFNDLPSFKIKELARRLGIPRKANQLISQPYNCAFFLLGESYLTSLGLPFTKVPNFPCLFLAGPSNHKKIPRRRPYYHYVPIGQDEAVAFSYNTVGLKGHIFKLFVEQIIKPVPKSSPHLLSANTPDQRLHDFLENPTRETFLEIVEPFKDSERLSNRQNQLQAIQTNMFTPTILERPDSKKAKNYGRPMRYFIPDWDDLVDPDYIFETDTGKIGKRKYEDEVYAHQIYAKPNYDGLLFSKSTVEDGAVKTALVRESGIHKFARFEGKPILGDCGAFTYITAKDPPYETPEILEYYQNLGFDYGVSIDHLIIPAFYEVKEYRYELTRRNAREFIEQHRKGGYKFTPIGVAQGWSPETYRDAVVELLEWGYQYVALGGLARAKTEQIYEILEVVAPVLHEETDLHLFGVARDRDGDEMRSFRELGVTSFDSASYLRRAWLSEKTNYFTADGKRYAALRISPVYPSSPRVKSLLDEGLATIEQLQKLEHNALKAVRDYDHGRLSLEATLAIVLEIDKLEEYNYDAHQELYRRVLEDRPWKNCPCEVCQSIGIEVIIFRRNDRNRRRGFHNTYAFYQRFCKLLKL